MTVVNRIIDSSEAEINCEGLSFVTMGSSTVPSSTHPPETLGAALDGLDVRLRRAGLQLAVMRPNGYNDEKPSQDEDSSKLSGSIVSGKILRCPQLVEFAISQAIDVGCVTLDKVGVKLSPTEYPNALKAGNVVALYNTAVKSFLRCQDLTVDYEGGEVESSTDLPSDWGAERFLVVAAGKGRVAFFCPIERCFLRMESNGNLVANESLALHTDDRPRVDEIFEVENLMSDTPTLHNSYYNKDGYANGYGREFEVIQIAGLDFPE